MNVALIIFNRPDLTEIVFAEIAKAKPSRLFVIADGPRPEHVHDKAKCAAARAVIERVDWDCEVFKRYSDVNLGCGRGPAEGLTWVFEQVESAIILEDDCLANQSFFRFAEELLEKYADDESVVQICGNFHHFGRRRGKGSYFFSRHNLCAGGFATWRRAWRFYDIKISSWPELRKSTWLLDITKDLRAEKIWGEIFDKCYAAQGKEDFWDYQWTYACWLQNGVSVVPNVGLLSNLGFRPDGTHTKSSAEWANLPMAEMVFPLVHPSLVRADYNADRYFVGKVAKQSSRPGRGRRIFRGIRRRMSYAGRTVAGLLGALISFRRA